MSSVIELAWEKFGSWEKVMDADDAKYEFPCVYVLCEKDGSPLYIGSTTSRWRENDGKPSAGGLRSRYRLA